MKLKRIHIFPKKIIILSNKSVNRPLTCILVPPITTSTENSGYIAAMVLNATFNCIFVIVAVSFIGGGNRSTRKKPPTYDKSLTNFIT